MRADRMERVGMTDSGSFGVFAPSDQPVDPATGYHLLVGVSETDPRRALFRVVGEDRRYRNPGEDAAPPSTPEEASDP
jgi:hypothetical protein